MTDPRDERPLDPSPATDDRVAAAEHRAAAAEHRAEAAERRIDDDGDDRSTVVREKPTYGLGSLLALLGGLAIALSTILVWGKEGLFQDGETKGSSTSIQFLWDISPADTEQPAVLFVLLPAAILVLIGAFIPRLRVLALIGGIVALVVAVLFVISVGRATSSSDLTIDEGTFELIGIGVWLAGIGGIVAIIGALMIPRRAVVR
jgi:hypothetical protein